MLKKLSFLSFAEIFLFFSLFFVGVFHEYLSCFASVIMFIWLIYEVSKNKKLQLNTNITSISIAVIVLFYGLTAFWAIDSGMAIIGFFKFMPVLIYLFILMQRDDIKEGLIQRLPIYAAIMTIISAIGMQIPVLEDFFSVAGRLSGFFQYPNTFAIFLLVSELIILARQKFRIFDYILILILLFGILYSGSRTVFVLSAISNIILLFTVKSKKVKLFFGGALLIIITGIVAYVFISGNSSAFSRFLTISLKESTFVGRFLYFKDALPVILKHPFGLGYMGYYYIQQSIQTGLYSVMFIHNDFLQLLLDIGWIPALVFIIAIAKCIFTGKKPFYKRVILCTIALHTCFDFNLQFIAFFMVLLLFTDYDSGKIHYINKNAVVSSVGILSIVACLYFGFSMTLSYFGAYDAAFAIYPFDTRTQTEILIKEENVENSYNIARDILKRNEYVTVAHSAKARYAFSKGDFKSLIEYKKNIFEKAPFAYEEYEEYCYMLITGYNLYLDAGDTASAEICIEQLKATISKVHSIESKLSYLGKRIVDQPKTELPDDIENFINTVVINNE